MSRTYNIPDWPEFYPDQKDRLSPIALLVGVLVIAGMSFARLEMGNHITKGLGLILALAYAVRTYRTRIRPTPELFLYGLWMVWSLGGLFSDGVYPELFWWIWKRILLVWFLLLIVGGFTDSRRTLSFNLVCFLIGAGIVAGYSYVTGEYRSAVSEEVRVVGMAGNANTFGWVLLLATMALAYFWMLPSKGTKTVRYVVIGTLMVVAAVGTILSGSRKGVLALALFYIMWGWTCYRREAMRRPLLLFAILVIFAVSGYGFVSFASKGRTGRRFAATWKALKGERAWGSGADRANIYREGIKLFFEHPVIGVGLNHFKVHVGVGAHSEYLEIACDTGLVGFVLYFAIFFTLWRRTGKISRYSSDPTEVRTCRLIRAVIVTIMFINFGRWNYDILDFWMLFAFFIGYTHAVWEGIRGEAALMAAEMEYPQPVEYSARYDPFAPSAPPAGAS